MMGILTLALAFARQMDVINKHPFTDPQSFPSFPGETIVTESGEYVFPLAKADSVTVF